MKPTTAFSVLKTSDDGLWWECKACKRIRDRERHERKREERIEATKAWKQAHPERQKVYQRRYLEKVKAERQHKRAQERGATVWGAPKETDET